MVPSHDPEAPHLEMVFYGGCWRTPEGVERKRAHMRIYNAARNQTMEGRDKRLDESLRRTWRRRAQRIAEHGGAPMDEARVAELRTDFAAGLTFSD